MAAPALISKLYVLPNSANAGTRAACAVSGCTTGAAKTGTEAQITAANTITITNAPAGTYAAIVTTAGTRSTILRAKAAGSPDLYHITNKSGDDSSMTLTISEAPATDAVNRNWAIGGPFDTLQDAVNLVTASSTIGGFDRVWASNEGGAAEAVSATTTIPTSANGTASGIPVIEGYNAAEGDGGLYVLDITGTANVHVVTVSATKTLLRNLRAMGFSGSGRGFSDGGGTNQLENCWATGTGAGTGAGIYVATGTQLIGCVADAAGSYGIHMSGTCVLLRCVARANGNSGIYGGVINPTILDCLLVGNARGIEFARTQDAIVRGCIIDGNSGDGIKTDNTTTGVCAHLYEDNVLTNNSGYGINVSGVTLDLQPQLRNNAYYLNSSGQVNNVADAYRSGEVTLTGDPYVDRANGNFAPNNTAGAGAALRAAGLPGAYPAGTTAPVIATTAYRDIGAQHQSPTLPSADDVRDGVAVGDDTGNLVLPTEAQVEDNIGFGSNGTEFEGTLVAGGGGGGGSVIGSGVIVPVGGGL